MNDILQHHFKKTQPVMMRKRKRTSGLLQENSFIVHVKTQSQTVRAERRIISYSVEVHRRYQNDSYILGCIDGENTLKITGTWMEKENYWMYGEASQD